MVVGDADANDFLIAIRNGSNYAAGDNQFPDGSDAAAEDNQFPDGSDAAAEDNQFPDGSNSAAEGNQFPDDTESADEGSDRQKKKKKKKRKSTRPNKGQLNAAKLATARLSADPTNYLSNTDAVELSSEELLGEGNELQFGAPRMEGGGLDLNSDRVTDAMRELAYSFKMTEFVSGQFTHALKGVQDGRFKSKDLSLAASALQLAEFRAGGEHNKWGNFNSLFETLIRDGDGMDPEARTDLNELIKDLMDEVRKSANVVGLAVNATAITANYTALEHSFFCIIDEGARLSFADFLNIIAFYDIQQLWIVGDRAQGRPIVNGTFPLQGCMDDLSQSIMDYLHKNDWPSSELFLQRRGIMTFASQLHYDGKLKDAPCTLDSAAHPWTEKIRVALDAKFPGITSKLPIRAFEIHGYEAMKDEITGSWLNLSTATFIVNLVEYFIRVCGLPAHLFGQITHYTAQQKLYRHAFAELDSEFPGYGFDKVPNFTTDSIQGEDIICPQHDSVRTSTLGFTNNRGRHCVLDTRACDFNIMVASTKGQRADGKKKPITRTQFNLARKEGVLVDIGPEKYKGWLFIAT
jgi:hypothetical protein